MGHWDTTRSSAGARLLVEAALERGLGVADCLAGSGLGLDELLDPSREIAAWQELTVLRNLMAAVDEPAFGVHLGLRTHLTAYGVTALAMLSAPTLRSVLVLLQAHRELTLSMSRVRLRPVGDEIVIEFDVRHLPESCQRVVAERDLAATVQAAREAIGQHVVCDHVEMSFPEVLARAYSDAFGVEPEFDAPRTAMWCSSEWLDFPLPQADPHVFNLACRESAALAQRRRSQTMVTGQVLDRLWSVAPVLPRLEQVAESLMTSPRTLRRRLAGEGTSYRRLVDQVRVGLALEYLRSGRMSVERIAGQLGYSDTPAFTHAFRRWTGISPSEWRRTKAGEPPAGSDDQS